ncbi:MAG: right-handed parallel beta-helix repeat-containing protein [Planctomycetota bacterium]|nr:right-handed parallel beta-helix repeat-containing protein [Planctomycetota bacterium]
MRREETNCLQCRGPMVPGFKSLVSACCALALLAAFPAAAGEAAGEAPPVTVEPAKAVDTSKPDHVVGKGTPDSVTAEALEKALAKGGIIVFNTGGQPATITVTKMLVLPVNTKPAVIDGAGLITLDGAEKSRIIQKAWKTELTVQRLRFINARTPDSGAAINIENWDGRLSVIDCQFENCKTTSPGPDIGGGAMRATGQKHFLISGCTFNNCEGSNGGADRGPNGKGGIGGAIYMDGCSQNADKPQLVVSDCLFQNSHANDHGGAIFAFTRPEVESLSVFNACIFDTSTVSPPKDQGLGFAGAIYSQDGKCFVTNCTFSNNNCPSLGGSVFIATDHTVRIANCEFYENKGGNKDPGAIAGAKGNQLENVSFKKQPQSPAITFLGRMPGPQKKQEAAGDTAKTDTKAKTEAKPAPEPKKVVKQASPETQKAWAEKLKARVQAAIAAKRYPSFTLHKPPSQITVRSLDNKDDMQVTMEAGLQTTMNWAKLDTPDHKSLALWLAAKEDTPQDHALAAFYLLLDDATEKAQEHMGKAGEFEKEVRGAFAPSGAAGR